MIYGNVRLRKHPAFMLIELQNIFVGTGIMPQGQIKYLCCAVIAKIDWTVILFYQRKMCMTFL
jgi:hypothetical protein